MHELSVAVELVELAAAEVERLGEVRAVALHLRLGPLAGVVEEALIFSFDVATAGTPLEGARLVIEREDVTAWCDDCAQRRTLASMHDRRCPECGRPTPRLLSGDSLELVALEIHDHVRPDR